MLDTIEDILHKIRMDNTLKESLNEILKDAEPELTTLANTATHNKIILSRRISVTISPSRFVVLPLSRAV